MQLIPGTQKSYLGFNELPNVNEASWQIVKENRNKHQFVRLFDLLPGG